MTMKAIQVRHDDSNSLHWIDVARPKPSQGEVLIEVHATACNRADLLQRMGRYPVPEGASTILGLEAAGIIADVGPGVTEWKVGDAVCCLLAGGGYAEYVVSPASLLLPIPNEMTMSEAAAIPEVFYTAYLNIYLEGQCQRGETVLVHAGASGVGTAAIQLCRTFENPVIATASTTKLEILRDLGVLSAIDRQSENFVDVILKLTNGRGVDVILDPVGADYFEKNIACLSRHGRLVIIGLLSGAKTTLSLAPILMKGLSVVGSVLRSRTIDEKRQITSQILHHVWPLFESGELFPIIDSVFPIEQAEKAHNKLRRNQTVGKVVLQVRP